MDAKLVMLKQSGERKEFSLSRASTIIGRSEECGLRIPLADVSRKHCEIAVAGGKITVKDLGSANGTFVNDKQISGAASLKAGDRLRVGPITFALQIGDKPVEVPAPAAAPAEDEVVELEAIPEEELMQQEDIPLQAAEDEDPIAALEALADEGHKKPKKK